MSRTKRIAWLGILCGLSLVSYILESLLPSLALPGAKIGLSNIFSTLAIVLLGLPSALAITVVRTVLGSFIVGSISSLVYSLTAGVVATIVSYLLYKVPKRALSLPAISVTAAVTHNITQNGVFCLVTQSAGSFALLPYLLLFGVVSGFITGLLVLLILKTVPFHKLGKGGNLENN